MVLDEYSICRAAFVTDEMIIVLNTFVVELPYYTTHVTYNEEDAPCSLAMDGGRGQGIDGSRDWLALLDEVSDGVTVVQGRASRLLMTPLIGDPFRTSNRLE
jgi:hypothetical protein